MFQHLRALAAILCVFSVTGCATPQHQAQCVLPAAHVLASEGDAHAPNSSALTVVTIDAAPLWSSEATPPALELWRAQIQTQTDVEPAHLLAQSNTPNNAIVAAHPEWISSATCLEQALLAQQYARVPLANGSTEFAAFILRSADGKHLRIYNYTRNADGIGRTTPLTDAMQSDLTTGWRFAAMLHNHNFHPGQPTLNGITAPSGPDAQLAKSLSENDRLESMWITNGINTVRIRSTDFVTLTDHD